MFIKKENNLKLIKIIKRKNRLLKHITIILLENIKKYKKRLKEFKQKQSEKK